MVSSATRLSLVGILIVVFCAAGFPATSLAAGSSTDRDTSKPTQDYFEQGKEAVEQERFEQAVEYFEKARESDPENPDLLNMLAYSQRKTGALNRAIENYHKALELRPLFPEAREYLGEAYLQAALRELQTLKEYGSEGEEQYRELKEVLEKTLKNLE